MRVVLLDVTGDKLNVIGHFQIAYYLSLKAERGAQPLVKISLFASKWKAFPCERLRTRLRFSLASRSLSFKNDIPSFWAFFLPLLNC